ncbi:MAG: DNA repair protein RecO [Planctomycetota bacterium]|jgi:DNA repair protein RecO (recombination protein O)
MLTKDEAICIRAVDYSETSQIVTFFARETGRIGAIAKGSKRPKSSFGGPIEVFSYGKIVVSVPNKDKLATLTEFEVNLLTNEYDPHPKLFDSLLQFLKDTRATSHERRATLSLLILFQLALLKEIGLQPVLDTCVNCKSNYCHSRTSGNWSEVYFSSSANGLICRDCDHSFPDKIRLTETAADALSNLNLLADLDKTALNQIERILVHHFTELLHRPPKMAKYILQT